MVATQPRKPLAYPHASASASSFFITAAAFWRKVRFKSIRLSFCPAGYYSTRRAHRTSPGRSSYSTGRRSKVHCCAGELCLCRSTPGRASFVVLKGRTGFTGAAACAFSNDIRCRMRLAAYWLGAFSSQPMRHTYSQMALAGSSSKPMASLSYGSSAPGRH